MFLRVLIKLISHQTASRSQGTNDLRYKETHSRSFQLGVSIHITYLFDSRYTYVYVNISLNLNIVMLGHFHQYALDDINVSNNDD